MLKTQIYSIKGVKTGEFTLPKVFDVEVNPRFLAQAIRVYEERSHVGLRNTKTRSEVNRTGKKLYKQKGTGGARHGSRRANVFVGNGVIFGPRALRRILTIPTQMKLKAKVSAISAKVAEHELIVVEDLNKLNKTKIGAELTANLTKELKSKRFTFLLSEPNAKIGVNIRNLKNSISVPFKDANAYDILNGGMVVVDSEVFAEKEEGKTKSEKVKKAQEVKIQKSKAQVKSQKPEKKGVKKTK